MYVLDETFPVSPLTAEMVEEAMRAQRPRWDEMEASLWASGAPLNMAEDSDDDDGDDSDDGDDDDDSDGDDGDDDEGDKPVTKADLDKVYAKLRTAEDKAAKAEKALRKKERDGMGNTEKVEHERDEAVAESGRLQQLLDEKERDDLLTTVAKGLKFKHASADKIKRFVDGDSKDEKSIRADLKEALKDYPELKADGAPPPPVDENGKPKAGNSGMNAEIRRMAGRA